MADFQDELYELPDAKSKQEEKKVKSEKKSNNDLKDPLVSVFANVRNIICVFFFSLETHTQTSHLNLRYIHTYKQYTKNIKKKS